MSRGRWLSTIDGPYGLTVRELDVVRLVVNGYTNQEIAGYLWLTVQTVKFHMTRALQKMECRNRVELAVRWVREQEHPS